MCSLQFAYTNTWTMSISIVHNISNYFCHEEIHYLFGFDKWNLSIFLQSKCLHIEVVQRWRSALDSISWANKRRITAMRRSRRKTTKLWPLKSSIWQSIFLSLFVTLNFSITRILPSEWFKKGINFITCQLSPS